MTKSSEAGVDVVVRYHDARRSSELSKCLFSLWTQKHHPVQPIVVTQNVPRPEVDRVIDEFDWDELRPRPIVHVVDAAPPADCRARLLNLGMAAGRARYVAFLDFDDLAYPDAYSYLVGRLRAATAAIAFGGIVVKRILWYGDVDFVVSQETPFRGRGLLDLFRDNFCPIHSFVIDRERVAPQDLQFDESMTRLEDYDFLLRLCSRYESDFKGLSQVVGIYRWRVDGGNTIIVPGAPASSADEAAWAEARERIAALKARLRPNATVAALLSSDLG